MLSLNESKNHDSHPFKQSGWVRMFDIIVVVLWDDYNLFSYY
jgi:hypothetical protein